MGQDEAHPQSQNGSPVEPQNIAGSHYKGYMKFEENISEYEFLLGQLCPQLAQSNHSLTIVSLIFRKKFTEYN